LVPIVVIHHVSVPALQSLTPDPAWARQILRRIEGPMDLFRQHPEVLQSPVRHRERANLELRSV
jgi:hypothetical protein